MKVKRVYKFLTQGYLIQGNRKAARRKPSEKGKPKDQESSKKLCKQACNGANMPKNKNKKRENISYSTL